MSKKCKRQPEICERKEERTERMAGSSLFLGVWAGHSQLYNHRNGLAGLVGGIVGIPIGWLWYRWRGDVF